MSNFDKQKNLKKLRVAKKFERRVYVLHSLWTVWRPLGNSTAADANLIGVSAFLSTFKNPSSKVTFGAAVQKTSPKISWGHGLGPPQERRLPLELPPLRRLQRFLGPRPEGLPKNEHNNEPSLPALSSTRHSLYDYNTLVTLLMGKHSFVF